MSKSVAYKHYIRALSRWPKDALRPECQFQDSMRRRIDKRFLPSTAEGAAAPSSAVVDERAELEQANILYSLLENRYSRKYPITGSLMEPASNPTHYVDLVRELQEAPERTWMQRTVARWRGALRMK